ncbi:A24 family peptidase [Erythrobacter sp. Alg231-14]|uniref:A24 family peptidase n=1 Tax=Erythrobacter sp. Alg231-14 TaxID=1922225 RepID=UPI00307BC12D
MTTIQYGLLIALAIALIFAAVTDIQRRQIDNWLNICIALGAPAFWWASGLSLWPDMAWQIGFAVVITSLLMGILAIGYNTGILFIGGGDAKLLAALSLWLMPMNYLSFLIVMAMFGGLMAVGFIARRIVFKPKTPGRLPYGVAIAFGALWVLFPKLIAVPTFA